MSSTTAKLKVYLVLCTVRHLDPTPMENPALHGLKAYLESLPDINDRFDIEVYEYAPVASVPVLDSEWHYSRVVSTLLAEQPDILCFSLYAWNITQCCELASWVKQVSPEIAMVAGGPEVFEREAFTGQFPVFDLVVEGDGELPLQEILVQHAAGNREPAGIPNVSFRNAAGGFTHNKTEARHIDLASVPDLSRTVAHLLPTAVAYLTSRGCPNHCTFCLWSKQPLTQRPREQILGDLEVLVGAPQVEHLFIADHDLLEVHDDEMLAQIFDVVGRRTDLSAGFFVTPQNAASDRLARIVRSYERCHVSVGLQSTCVETSRLTGRPWAVESMKQLAEIPQDVKDRIVLEVMYPLPGETPVSFFTMLKELIDMGYVRIRSYALMLLRGTALRRHAKRFGLEYLPMPPYYCFQTPTFPREDYWDAVGVSLALTRLSHGEPQPERTVTLRRFIGEGNDLIARLLSEVQSHRDPEQIYANLVRDVYGADAVQEIERMPGGIRRDDAALVEETPKSTPSLEPNAEQTDFRARLAAAGVIASAAHFDGTTLTAEVDDRGAGLILVASPKEQEGKFYVTTGRYKIAYSGAPKDMETVDRFIEFVKEMERETRES